MNARNVPVLAWIRSMNACACASLLKCRKQNAPLCVLSISTVTCCVMSSVIVWFVLVCGEASKPVAT